MPLKILKDSHYNKLLSLAYTLLGGVMKLSDMQKKDIVFLKDGKKLGKIIDAEIEVNTGLLKNLLIEKRSIKSLFTSEGDMLINFNQIKKIGEDVILVDTTR